MQKPTKKQFEIYKKECEKWIEIFGLKDWEIFFDYEDVDGSPASLTFHCINRIAIFHFGPKQEKSGLNNQQIKRNAFHEVCELLLCRLRDMTEQRYGLTKGDIDEEIHIVIGRLQKAIKNPLS